MAISFVNKCFFLSFRNEAKNGAPRERCHCSPSLCCHPPLPSPLLFYSLLIVIVLRSMPTKKDLRNKVGAIVHAVANRALSDHTAKNIFGNVNYAKYFLQGTVVGFFDGRAPGGENAAWKLTVDFEMPSDGAEDELKRVDIHRQHCILGQFRREKTLTAPRLSRTRSAIPTTP
jgi:hypothetical protein